MSAAHRLPQRSFVAVAGLFTICVLAQIFIAGNAALLAPEDWSSHVTWVHIFQWVSIALPASAYWASRRIGFTLLNCLPMVIIGLQYYLVHQAIRRGDAALVGLHAMGGAVLLGLLVFILQEWRYRPQPDQRLRNRA